MRVLLFLIAVPLYLISGYLIGYVSLLTWYKPSRDSLWWKTKHAVLWPYSFIIYGGACAEGDMMGIRWLNGLKRQRERYLLLMTFFGLPIKACLFLFGIVMGCFIGLTMCVVEPIKWVFNKILSKIPIPKI